MARITQADIARALRVHQMAVSRTVRMLGGMEHPLSDHSALCLLTVGALREIGLTYPVASELVSKFDREIRYVALDPEHRTWIVFVEKPEASFQIAAVSHSHLEAVLAAHPLSPVLDLRQPVERALAHLAELKAAKEAA